MLLNIVALTKSLFRFDFDVQFSCLLSSLEILEMIQQFWRTLNWVIGHWVIWRGADVTGAYEFEHEIGEFELF